MSATRIGDGEREDMDLKKPGLRGAFAFGVIAATLEMGALLFWMMRCRPDVRELYTKEKRD